MCFEKRIGKEKKKKGNRLRNINNKMKNDKKMENMMKTYAIDSENINDCRRGESYIAVPTPCAHLCRI